MSQLRVFRILSKPSLRKPGVHFVDNAASSLFVPLGEIALLHDLRLLGGNHGRTGCETEHRRRVNMMRDDATGAVCRRDHFTSRSKRVGRRARIGLSSRTAGSLSQFLCRQITRSRLLGGSLLNDRLELARNRRPKRPQGPRIVLNNPPEHLAAVAAIHAGFSANNS